MFHLCKNKKQNRIYIQQRQRERKVKQSEKCEKRNKKLQETAQKLAVHFVYARLRFVSFLLFS